MEGYRNPSLIAKAFNFSKQITQVLDFSNEIAWILSFSKPGWPFIEIMQLLEVLSLKTRGNDCYDNAGEETFANISIYVYLKSARAQNTRMQEISFKLKKYASLPFTSCLRRK